MPPKTLVTSAILACFASLTACSANTTQEPSSSSPSALSGKGDPGKGDPGKGDPGKGDPGKGDPGKGDPGKGDPGKGDPGVEDPKGDPGCQPPPEPATKCTYSTLGDGKSCISHLDIKVDASAVCEKQGLSLRELATAGSCPNGASLVKIECCAISDDPSPPAQPPKDKNKNN
jgi:hypothetical protein